MKRDEAERIIQNWKETASEPMFDHRKFAGVFIKQILEAVDTLIGEKKPDKRRMQWPPSAS